MENPPYFCPGRCRHTVHQNMLAAPTFTSIGEINAIAQLNLSAICPKLPTTARRHRTGPVRVDLDTDPTPVGTGIGRVDRVTRGPAGENSGAHPREPVAALSRWPWRVSGKRRGALAVTATQATSDGG